MLALITDGNATDDSGIDSICCDSAVSPSGGFLLSAVQENILGVGFNTTVSGCLTSSGRTGGCVVQCNRRCLSPGELPGLGTLAEEDCAEEEEEEEEENTGRRSFLYDSFAGGGSRKHTSSVWRRELVIAGPELN